MSKTSRSRPLPSRFRSARAAARDAARRGTARACRERRPRARPAQELRRPRGRARDRLRDRAPARCSACSARTAPARRRPSRSSRATATATAARSRCSARTRSAPARAWRERLGVVLQSSSLYPNLTAAREPARSSPATTPRPRDVDEVIEIVGLGEKADARARTLSGGQKRRLDLGLALVGDPELIFLDEPTTGFDPRRAPRRPGRRSATSARSARRSC